MIDNKELYQLAEFILKDKIDYSEDNDELKHVKAQNKNFKRVYDICNKFCDFRTHLWLSLPVKDRLLLVVSEYDKREKDLMSLLILKQYSKQK